MVIHEYLDRLSLKMKATLGSTKRKTRTNLAPSVDFNDAVFPRLGIQRILNITFPYHAEMSDNLESSTPKHVVLFIWECLRRSDDDAVAGMCTKWVEVLPTYINDGKTAALFTFNHVIARFGVPTQLVTDHG